MSCSQRHRGGAPVGYITELTGPEAASVIYLRLWCEGGSRKQEIFGDFASVFDEQQADRLTQTFGELCRMCVQHGRRPLIRHSVQCKCLGGDEACFANFISYAADGEREDALLMATLMVRPDMAPLLTSLATEIGLAFKQMRLAAPSAVPTPTHQHATIH